MPAILTNLAITFTQSPELRVLAGLVFLAVFGTLFFRLSRGTGKAAFVVLSLGLAALFWLIPLAQLPALVVLAALWALEVKRSRGQRPAYAPAAAIAEGGGVKRGLTAPEAANLLELPSGTVLAAVLVGLLKKGVLSPGRSSPLVVDVAPEYRVHGKDLDIQGRAAHRREAAQRHSIILHPFEEPFLKLLEENVGQPLKEINFAAPQRALVRHTERRVNGYNLEATRDYYRKHLGRARHDISRKSPGHDNKRLLDHHLEWLLLDEEFARPYQNYQANWIPPGETGLESWLARLKQELDASLSSQLS